MRINVDANGDMNCFDRIFELRRQKCNENNCNSKCTHIVKGKMQDKFYCKRHFVQKVKKGEVESHMHLSFRYELAKLLVYLGFVKEKR